MNNLLSASKWYFLAANYIPTIWPCIPLIWHCLKYVLPATFELLVFNCKPSSICALTSILLWSTKEIFLQLYRYLRQSLVYLSLWVQRSSFVIMLDITWNISSIYLTKNVGSYDSFFFITSDWVFILLFLAFLHSNFHHQYIAGG